MQKYYTDGRKGSGFQRNEKLDMWYVIRLHSDENASWLWDAAAKGVAEQTAVTVGIM